MDKLIRRINEFGMRHWAAITVIGICLILVAYLLLLASSSR